MGFERICIVGVGLLGGSIGMAAKVASMPARLVGWGHRRETLQRALESSAIDEAAESLPRAVAGADLVILCTPVGRFQQMLEEMGPHLKAGAIVTDVGSTKRSVVRLAARHLPRGVHFVGSHPMAGSEKRGVEYARADLFSGSLCILTPTRSTDGSALEQVEAFWQALGMRTTRLPPQRHDRLLADISHLPHALAAALVAMQHDEALPLAGKGFLDTTRIAGGDGALWRDILLDNRDSLSRSLRALRQRLDRLQQMLDKNQADALEKWLNDAAARREVLLRQKLPEVTPD